MKLVHPDLSGQILISRDRVCEWVMESPRFFGEYVGELHEQIDGKSGRFVLSEEDNEIDMSKAADIILNPFSVNVNDKRVLGRLYEKLQALAYDEEMFLETKETLSLIEGYFAEIEQHSDYMLSMEKDVNVISLFKTLNVKLMDCSSNFVENIEQYIKIAASLLNRKLIVMVNMNSYMDILQKEQLIKAAKYNEIALLFIDNIQRGFSDGSFYYIIDKDGCEIYE